MQPHSAYIGPMDSLLRHIRACNNADLPGLRVEVLVAGEQVGWMLPELAEQAVAWGAARVATGILVRPEQLQDLARALADRGAFPWRAEPFDVRARPEGEVLGQLDRGALPAFGVQATGVHVNGLAGDRLWVARRASHKLLDPGKLDHLAAGGVAAGHSPRQTVIKEAEEEAAVPPALARTARHTATIAYAMERPEGLRRDCLWCYDLELPENWRPEPRDGEVEAFELWELSRVLHAVRHTDAFKFNVNLVLIDLFLRQGLVGGDEAAALRAALYGSAFP